MFISIKVFLCCIIILNIFMDNMKTVLGKILLEVPAIVLAVFLALAVNNCNEDLKKHTAAGQTMEAIFKEVQENKAALENNLADNRKTMEHLEVAMDSIKDDTNAVISGVEMGYEQTFLGQAAWEMAQLTGATQQFVPEEVQTLSIIYDLQEMYLDQGDRFFAQITTPAFHQTIEDNPKAQLKASLTLLKLANKIGEKTLEKYNDFLEGYSPK